MMTTAEKRPVSDSENPMPLVDQPGFVVAQVGQYEFSQRQMKAIVDGMNKTQRTVPNVEGPNVCYIIMRKEDDWDRPLGAFFLFPIEYGGESFAEIGVRFWERSNVMYRFILRGLYLLFEHYAGAIARVYANNRAVKGLLQRGGFRLMKRWSQDDVFIAKDGQWHETSRTIELYGLKREDFYALWDDPEEAVE